MALKMDPNAGPLTLEHDPRPRDLTNDPSLGAPLYQDFRFKGWPDGSFQHTHQPQYKKMSASYMNPPDVNRYFGKSQHFDTARPKMDDGFNGQQYTSRDFVDPQPLSGPARGLGFDEHERDRKRRENDDMEADRIRVKNEERLRALQRDDERRRPDRNSNSNQFWNLFSDRGDVTSFRLIPAKANVMADLWKTFRKDVTGYQPSMPTDPRRERSYDDKQIRQEELRKQEQRLTDLKSELEHLKTSQQYSDRYDDSFQDRARDNKENYDRAPDSNRSYYNPNEEYDNLGKIGKAKKPNREVLPIYYPFGKPGGGAPIVDRNNRITTTLHGYSDDTSEARRQKAINAKVLAATLDQQVEHEQRRKQLEKDDKRRPFGELAVILADKPVGKPRRNPATGEIANHHLGLSDISRQKMNYQPFHKSDQRAYHNELDGMSDERRRRLQLGKLKDYQEGRQHYDTMDSLWGKHGGGAPKGYGLRKANLEDILHHPTRDQSTEEYIKKKDWSEVEPDKNPLTAREDGSFSPHGNPKKFVRSTVTSNHANQYDYRDDYPKKDYKIGAPYATN